MCNLHVLWAVCGNCPCAAQDALSQRLVEPPEFVPPVNGRPFRAVTVRASSRLCVGAELALLLPWACRQCTSRATGRLRGGDQAWGWGCHAWRMEAPYICTLLGHASSAGPHALSLLDMHDPEPENVTYTLHESKEATYLC